MKPLIEAPSVWKPFPFQQHFWHSNSLTHWWFPDFIKGFFSVRIIFNACKILQKVSSMSNMIQKLYLDYFEDEIYLKWIHSKTRRRRFLSVWMSWESTEEPMFPFPPKDSTLSRLFSAACPPAKTTLKSRSNAANNPRVMQNTDKQLIMARTGDSFFINTLFHTAVFNLKLLLLHAVAGVHSWQPQIHWTRNL